MGISILAMDPFTDLVEHVLISARQLKASATKLTLLADNNEKANQQLKEL